MIVLEMQCTNKMKIGLQVLGFLIMFLLRGLFAGAPNLALVGLGPEIDIFLFRGLFAGAADLALVGLGPEMVIFY